jgi:hypothetical protein
MNISNYASAEIEASLKWFLSFMSDIHWKDRKQQIEKAILQRPGEYNPQTSLLSDMKFLSVKDDRIGWYLYLMECLLTDITKYEPIQGARIAPIFERFGIDIVILKSIEGVDAKIKKLLKKEKAQADAILFELLTALVWAKNGWNVKFIPEGGAGKTADILAIKDGDNWYVECKRLSQNSEYSIKERNKWLKMLSGINIELLLNNLLLDVVFHVELDSLDDDFLKTELSGKLTNMAAKSIKISNDIWDISVSFVDMKSINDHLKYNYVKNASNQLKYLIGGTKGEDSGFSAGVNASLFSIGENMGINLYIASIANAFGVSWKCDAPASIDAKARNIWNQVKTATDQIPKGHNAAIHIGLETLDGTFVEHVRFEKIRNSMSLFDVKDKKINVLYCHFFQSYAPLDQAYVIDETISRFFSGIPITDYPLKHDFLIVPRDDSGGEDVHWLREHP